MADLITKTCDTCGAIKKAANHWFKAFELEKPNVGILILPAEFTEPQLPAAKRLDLCSESCISKAVSRALSNGH